MSVPLRKFDREPPALGELVLGRDEGGPRHFLDGRPVPCGTFIERSTPTGWVVVRYESLLAGESPRAMLYAGEGGPNRYATPSDRFRWPTEERESWWVDKEITIQTGFGPMVAIRDVNRLVVAFARLDDAKRIAAGGGA